MACSANHGHGVELYLIDKIIDGEGNVLFIAGTGGMGRPEDGAEPPQVIACAATPSMDGQPAAKRGRCRHR